MVLHLSKQNGNNLFKITLNCHSNVNFVCLSWTGSILFLNSDDLYCELKDCGTY